MKVAYGPTGQRPDSHSGKFGAFADSQQKASDNSYQSRAAIGVSKDREKVSTTRPPVQDNSKTSSDRLTASEFFNSIWHDKPVQVKI